MYEGTIWYYPEWVIFHILMFVFEWIIIPPLEFFVENFFLSLILIATFPLGLKLFIMMARTLVKIAYI